MYRKIFALFALLAVLFGCAFAQDAIADNIQLNVFGGSSKHWIAVDPINDDDATVKVEYIEASSEEWVEMALNEGWGYWHAASSNTEGFDLPVSFRLTSEQGEEAIMDNVLTYIAEGSFESGAKYARGRHDDDDEEGCPAPTTRPTQAPTTRPPTQAPTTRPTQPATRPPTQAPTEEPTRKPTQKPTEEPTRKPTQRPTEEPTRKPTEKPTEKPTKAPTQKPTEKPTEKPTKAPTQKPTEKPTEKPTKAPTQKPTEKPTQAPTPKPTTKPSTSGSSSGGNTDLCAIVPTSQEPVKILVPLYMEPGKGWDDLIAASNAGTKIVAIINPSSGPVSSGPSTNWRNYMDKMKAANIDMVGYVHTSYGDRSMSTVKAEIDTYANKYPGLKGIFLDEASNKKEDLSYYKQVYDHIMSKSGYIHDILNPGASTDLGYLDVSTNVVVYESNASGYKTPTASWIKCAPSASQKAGYKYKFSGIVYSASQSQMTSIVSQMANAGMGMVFITDRGLPNPYNPLPSYFSAQASAVRGL